MVNTVAWLAIRMVRTRWGFGAVKIGALWLLKRYLLFFFGLGFFLTASQNILLPNTLGPVVVKDAWQTASEEVSVTTAVCCGDGRGWKTQIRSSKSSDKVCVGTTRPDGDGDGPRV